jgi:hypothetical protein
MRRYGRGRTSSDIQLIIKVIAYIFAVCAILAVVEAAVDAWAHQPLAEFLVKRFSELMLVCVTSIGSLLAGQSIERRNRKQSD